MMRKDPAMRAFVIHLAIFVLVVGGLATINLLRRPDHIWFIWVLAGWGIGVAAHDLALLLARTPRREAIFTDPAVRGFFIHAFVFVAVNALLIVVNLIATPGHYWFYLPLLAWAIVLAAHGYLVFHRQTPRAREPQVLREPEPRNEAKEIVVRHCRWWAGAFRRARRRRRVPDAFELRLDRTARPRARSRARPSRPRQGERRRPRVTRSSPAAICTKPPRRISSAPWPTRSPPSMAKANSMSSSSSPRRACRPD